MHVQQMTVQGEEFIGLLGMASDKYALLCKKFRKVSVLDVPDVKTTLYGTNLVGLLCAGNSNGLLMPYFVPEEEVSRIKKAFREQGVDLSITRLEDKNTALGNLIACNDKAAIVSPLIEDLKTVEETLGVELEQTQVGGHDEAGACCVATNKGFLVHPDAEADIVVLEEIFGVSGMVGSVNFGFPFVKSGIIANSKGYVAGSRTTGIELGRIDDALGFME